MDEASGQRDDSYGTNHLTDNNTVGAAASPYFPEGNQLAASFVAANTEYLEKADNASLDLTTGMTIGGFLYMDNAIAQMCMVAKHNFSVSPSWAFQTSNLVESSGAFRVFIAADNGDTSGNNFATYNSPALVNDTWYHAVFVFDGTLAEADRVKVYLNASAMTASSKTGTWASSLNNSTAALRFGDFQGLNRYWQGLLDEWVLWNRPLSAAEIAVWFNGGTGLALESFS
jgi:hypothetical protein